MELSEKAKDRRRETLEWLVDQTRGPDGWYGMALSNFGLTQRDNLNAGQLMHSRMKMIAGQVIRPIYPGFGETEHLLDNDEAWDIISAEFQYIARMFYENAILSQWSGIMFGGGLSMEKRFYKTVTPKGGGGWTPELVDAALLPNFALISLEDQMKALGLRGGYYGKYIDRPTSESRLASLALQVTIGGAPFVYPNPLFSPDVFGYLANIGAEDEELTLLYTTLDEYALVVAPASPLAAPPGVTSFPITVTAEDFVTTSTYTFIVFNYGSNRSVEERVIRPAKPHEMRKYAAIK